jgi:hypothetical protein
MKEAVKVLQENGFENIADELIMMEIDLYSNDKVKVFEAAGQISAVCTVRSWGDLNIKTMNGWKWNTLLEKINNTAKRRVNKINAENT